ARVGGRTRWGVGLDAKIMTASLRAVVSAVNRVGIAPWRPRGEGEMDELISLLSPELPRGFRWARALPRQPRRHDITLAGKNSGYASTDALTLADLSVQEILVAALRDMGPVVRACRIEAEESTGDLGRFATQSDWVLGIDPIDGTRGYRDRIGI